MWGAHAAPEGTEGREAICERTELIAPSERSREPRPAQGTDSDSWTPPLAILQLRAMTKDLELKGLGSMTFRLRKNGGPDLCSDWLNLPRTSGWSNTDPSPQMGVSWQSLWSALRMPFLPRWARRLRAWT